MKKNNLSHWQEALPMELTSSQEKLNAKLKNHIAYSRNQKRWVFVEHQHRGNELEVICRSPF